MPKKERIPPLGKEQTSFLKKAKWRQLMAMAAVEIPGRNLLPGGAKILGNALAKNRFVATLDLCHNNIGDDGAIELAQFLKVNDTIQNLNLSCNKISDVGGIAIASIFIPYANATGAPSQWNRTIWSLNLSGNELGNDALVALCNAAACHRDLTKIDLSNNKIGAVGCKAFLRSMERNPMTTFLLGGNRIGDEGTRHYCDAIKRFGVKGAQSRLYLHGNEISKGGAAALGAMLESNDFVLDLQLANNTFGYKGTEALVEPLLNSSNTTLRSLTLDNNCLGDSGAAEIAKLIRKNLPGLLTISLNGNEISDAGAVALLQACAANTHLTTLALANNQVSMTPKTLEIFRASLIENKSLITLDLSQHPFDNLASAQITRLGDEASEAKQRAAGDQEKEKDKEEKKLSVRVTLWEDEPTVVYMDRIKQYMDDLKQQKAEEANKKKKKGSKK
jgi:Ran GTPase-activating protein (RanGAP) involved in mRNA processing and transport